MCSARIFKAAAPRLVSHVHFISPCGITGCIKFPLYGLFCCTCTWIGLRYVDCVQTLIDQVALNLPELQRREEEPFRRFNLGSVIAITALVLPWSRTFVGFSHHMRLLYVDVGHTRYYGIRDSKFRKFLEMTFPNAARPSSFADGSGFAAQPLRIGRGAGRCLG